MSKHSCNLPEILLLWYTDCSDSKVWRGKHSERETDSLAQLTYTQFTALSNPIRNVLAAEVPKTRPYCIPVMTAHGIFRQDHSVTTLNHTYVTIHKYHKFWNALVFHSVHTVHDTGIRSEATKYAYADFIYALSAFTMVTPYFVGRKPKSAC